MKVVSELIRHFISKGALKPDQIRFLVEGGYLTHPAEARLIATSQYRQKLAEAVAQGLRP